MESSSVVPRACYNCRIRKIKCNRDSPCSNCLTSNIPCQPSARPGRASNTATPAATGSNSSIRSLEDRLKKIENAVVSLARQNVNNQSSESPPGGVDQLLAQHSPISISNSSSWTDTPAFLQGDSTFEQQSFQASRISELSPTDNEASQRVAEQLRILETSLGQHDPELTAQIKSFQPPVMLKMEMIPSSFTLQVLRVASKQPSLLPIFNPVHDFAQFESLAQRVYFPLEPLSTGELTVFHGMLSFVLWELSMRPPDEVKIENIRMYQQACAANFKLGIDTNEVGAIATYENTLALCMGSLVAQMMGDIRRQNSLISAAARHCLTLGYHRKDDRRQQACVEFEKRRRLFWHVYMSEASLTLRLGRAAIIPDYDIDVPPIPISADPKRAPWGIAFELFVKFARLQAQMYSQLYSPASKALDPVRRNQIVNDLAMQMTRWRHSWQRLDYSKCIYPHIFENTFSATDVSYYSVLTLLYRGSTTSHSARDISVHCFQAARNGLEAHLSLFPKVAARGQAAIANYGVWILLFSSFTPFVVTFLYCISESDEPSLKLLLNVLSTLEEIATVHELVSKQYDMCKSLCQIAGTYLGSRSNPKDFSPYDDDKTLHLPLQLSVDENWNSIAMSFENWDPSVAGQQSLALNDNLG